MKCQTRSLKERRDFVSARERKIDVPDSRTSVLMADSQVLIGNSQIEWTLSGGALVTLYTTNNDSQLLVVPESVSKIRRAKDKGGEKKESQATTAGVLQRRPPVWKVHQADLWWGSVLSNRGSLGLGE